MTTVGVVSVVVESGLTEVTGGVTRDTRPMSVKSSVGFSRRIFTFGNRRE